MPSASDIRALFGGIAVHYDLLNRVLSLGTDRLWRRRVCDALPPLPGALAADLCCGTGDLALELSRRGARVVAADFSRPMLARAAAKGAPGLVETDCLRLPLPDGALDVVTIAFGARNLADLPAGLREMLRVLRPGGTLAVLEFAAPRGALFAALYRAWLRWLVPSLGAVVSGRRAAYAYLASSIQAFHDQEGFCALMREAGYTAVRHADLTRGVAALYLGRRPGGLAVSPSSAPPAAPSARGGGSPPDRR